MFGTATFVTPLDLGALDGTDGFALEGVAASGFSGFSVSGAGDVNGDGYGDVIVGAPYADPGGASEGTSYVVFGAASFGATVDLGALSGADGFALNGEALIGDSGRSVSGAGDVNGDGYDDVIIGAHFTDPGGAIAAGTSYVVFGASSFSATLEISTISGGEGSEGFAVNGEAESDHSGYSVSGAGDVNGDGFADLIVGARGAAPGGNSDAGTSYVIFGGE